MLALQRVIVFAFLQVIDAPWLVAGGMLLAMTGIHVSAYISSTEKIRLLLIALHSLLVHLT